MILKSYLFFLSLTIIVSAKLSSEDEYAGLQMENLLSSCKCKHDNCGCCQHIKIKRVHLDDTVCAYITYVPSDLAISLSITFNSHVVFKKTISARNPPPLCIGQHLIKQLKAEICIHFYNLNADKHHLHGCLKFEVKFHKIKLASFDLGCFDVRLKFLTDNSKATETWLGSILSKNEVPQIVMI